MPTADSTLKSIFFFFFLRNSIQRLVRQPKSVIGCKRGCLVFMFSRTADASDQHTENGADASKRERKKKREAGGKTDRDQTGPSHRLLGTPGCFVFYFILFYFFSFGFLLMIVLAGAAVIYIEEARGVLRLRVYFAFWLFEPRLLHGYS